MSNYSVSWSAAEVDEKVGKRPPGRFANACTRYGSSTVVIHGGLSWMKRRKFRFLEDLWLMKIPVPGHISWEPLTQRGQAPGPRANHHLCLASRRLYLFGGKKGMEDKRAVPGMFVYDYIAQCWYLQHVEGDEQPLALGSSASVIDDQIFVFGGLLDGIATSATHLFDPQMSTWNKLQASGATPSARCDHGACTVKSKLYIHGGCAAADVYLSDLYELDTNTLLWTRLEFGGFNNIPRAGHTLTAHHAKDLYVFGGHNDLIYPDGGPVTEDLCKFSLGQKRWKSPLACPTDFNAIITYDHCAVIVQGHLHIIGGLALDGMANDVQVARLISPSDRKGSRGVWPGRSFTPDLSTSGVYDFPPAGVSEEIYVEARAPMQEESSARAAEPEAIKSDGSVTPTPPAPEPELEPDPEPIMQIRITTPEPIQSEHSSRRSSSERRKLRSPPPIVPSLDEIDFGQQDPEASPHLSQDGRAWSEDNYDLDVPVETDNGNDDDSDVSSEERTLTTAERHQLEQLSAQMSSK